jgi:hypothetical protein
VGHLRVGSFLTGKWGNNLKFCKKQTLQLNFSAYFQTKKNAANLYSYITQSSSEKARALVNENIFERKSDILGQDKEPTHSLRNKEKTARLKVSFSVINLLFIYHWYCN